MKPAVINVQHSQPIIIGDDDNDDDNEAEQEQQRRRVSVPRNASKRARELGKPKQVGWADEDLKKYPFAANPKIGLLKKSSLLRCS